MTIERAFSIGTAVAFAFITAAAWAAPVKQANIGPRVDALFAQWNKPDTAGCALSVIQHDKVLYEHGYGMANLEHGVPITPETVFYIASVSKEFTAAAVALLAEEGKISLDDDIRKYVPEIPAYDRPITIRNLLHHTSGLRDYLGLWSKSGRSFADSIAEAEAIALIARQDGLDFSPGTAYRYSNSGYFLLSVIVKRASGKPLSAYAEEHIFKPLGMRHTHFHDDRTRIVPRRASSYFKRKPEEGGGLGVYTTSFDLVGDGGLLTTVRDFSLWAENFQHNVLGSRGQAFIEELLSTDPLSDGKANTYAFGLMHGEYNGMKTIGHGGSFLEFKASYLHVPQLDLSVVALCNLGDIQPTALIQQVVDIVAGERR